MLHGILMPRARSGAAIVVAHRPIAFASGAERLLNIQMVQALERFLDLL